MLPRSPEPARKIGPVPVTLALAMSLLMGDDAEDAPLAPRRWPGATEPEDDDPGASPPDMERG